MKALIASLALAFGWNALAFFLAGESSYGRDASPLNPEWLGAGLAAGLAAGAFTLWTGRVEKPPILELLTVIATYYLAVCVWWVTLGVGTSLVTYLASRGSGHSFYDLDSHLQYGYLVVLMATVYSPVTVPLCWLSRDLVRKQIKRPEVRGLA